MSGEPSLLRDLRTPGKRLHTLGIALTMGVLVVVLPALFPWLHWRRRLGWRGQLRFVAVQTVVHSALSSRMKRWAARRKADLAERRTMLTAALGREVRDEDVVAHGFARSAHVIADGTLAHRLRRSPTAHERRAWIADHYDPVPAMVDGPAGRPPPDGWGL